MTETKLVKVLGEPPTMLGQRTCSVIENFQFISTVVFFSKENCQKCSFIQKV